MSSTSATKHAHPERLSPELALDAEVTEQDRPEPASSLRDQIALVAYSHWEARGCPFGSAEEDWSRAEQEIRVAAQISRSA